jgi:hypothetical protein
MMLILLTLGCNGASVDACEGFGEVTAAGSVGHEELTEASGLVASAQHPGVFWTHNDSGDTARLYAIDKSGDPAGTLTLTGAIPEDWEDIARDGSTLYVGDIGDNAKSRDEIAIWRVTEPDTLEDDGSTGATRMTLTYPDGAHDAEALIHHDGALWILTKDADGAAIYKASDLTAESQTLSLADVLVLPDEAGEGAEITGADTSADGSSLLIRTETSVLVYALGGDLPDALAGTPCLAPAPDAADGESIAATDGGYAALSEGANPTLWLSEAS